MMSGFFDGVTVDTWRQTFLSLFSSSPQHFISLLRYNSAINPVPFIFLFISVVVLFFVGFSFDGVVANWMYNTFSLSLPYSLSPSCFSVWLTT